MNQMERAARDHAAEWLRYSKSSQYRKDAATDKARREASDRAAGHSPRCGIMQCAPDCPRHK
jgi:hypothetical protein